uniref:Rap-GAP domain-containing protein n=1 Tax=Arcella intermedia TaxID=1963864 RepID=A0A6B2L4Q0_9EUKA
MKSKEDTNELFTPDRSRGYEFETGTSSAPPGIVDFIHDNLTYNDYFYDIDHCIAIGEEEEIGPFIICFETTDSFCGNKRAVMFYKKELTRVMVPYEQTKTSKDIINFAFSKITDKQLTINDWNKIRWLEVQEMKEDILLIEKKMNFTEYKFGVLFAPEGKIAEDELYQNSLMSEDFREFLEWLGDKIPLSGWKQFKGGLDVRGTDLTGSHSYFTKYKGQSVMYHIGPFMPYKDNDPSRKRYIGNDVVVIIFKEGSGDLFDPTVMRSQYNHVFAVVHKVKTESGDFYRFEISNKPAVPPYPPYLPNPPLFPINSESRDLFLCKLINAERATIAQVPIFRSNLSATRESLINDLKNTIKEKRRTLHTLPNYQTTPVARKADEKRTSIIGDINYEELEERFVAKLLSERNINGDQSSFKQMVKTLFKASAVK